MIATTSDELLTVFRREVVDKVEPYLWDDDEVFGHMTEAFDALLKGADVSNKVLRLPFTAGVATVALPAKVTHIRAATIDGRPINQANTGDQMVGNADDYGRVLSGTAQMFDSSGAPDWYIRDYEAKALRLVPIPNIDGVLQLQVNVTVGALFETGLPLPSTDSQDLRLVLHYMKHLAFQKYGAMTYDIERSRDHKAQFDAGVEDRKQDLNNYRRAPGHIRPDF